MAYKFLEHTADVKFLAEGKTLEQAFKESAKALQKTMTKGTKIKDKIEKTIKIDAEDNESLVRAFLEEFLYLLDAEDFIFSKITEIVITGFKLQAKIKGDKASNYKISNEVKAITYNDMFVKKNKNWKI